MRAKRLLFLLLTLSTLNLIGQDCADNEALVTIEILTDDYPQETSWEVTLQDGTIIDEDNLTGYPTGTIYTAEVCVPVETCVAFIITDSANDGICCAYGEGYYTIYYDGEMLVESEGDFGEEESVDMGCPVGVICHTALVVEAEATSIAEFEDTWYVFEPANTGIYQITTCGLDNVCNTSIWIYSYCEDLDWDDSPKGSIFYGTNGCSDNADLTDIELYLEAGEVYYIRIGDEYDDCSSQTIEWFLTFSGPLEGCTDLEACNFDPLAVIDDGSCLTQGDENCPEGPDLIVLDHIIENSLVIQQKVNNDDCFIEENCMTGYGVRQILRFTTQIENIGDLDFYVGPEPENEIDVSTQWEWDPCHDHWHYESYAEYVLFDENNNKLPIGFKNGFCVMDLDCSIGGGDSKYHCENQGISVGCGDIYDAELDCQWIDITDISDGIYTFVVRVNWDKSFDNNGNSETNYINNWAQVCLHITTNSEGNKEFEVVESCEPYVDCLGETYGNAELDCLGECNGSALRGDYNTDQNFNQLDINAYLTDIVENTGVINPCNDLNDDEHITVTDAVLATACLLEIYTQIGEGDFCEFPFQINNPLETVTLSIGVNNPNLQYFEVNMKNSDGKVVGGQFSVQGIDIREIEVLDEDIANNFIISHSANEVIFMSSNLNALGKQADALPILKIYYENANETDICINEITAIVNDKREEVQTHINDNCVSSISGDNTSLNEMDDLNINIAPNPFKEKTVFTFDTNDDTFQLEIMDIDGKVLKRIDKIVGKQYELQRGNLSAGIYTYKIKGNNQLKIGKLVVL